MELSLCLRKSSKMAGAAGEYFVDLVVVGWVILFSDGTQIPEGLSVDDFFFLLMQIGISEVWGVS